jgi:hypothetical protein
MIWRARATRVVLAIARCPGIVKGGGAWSGLAGHAGAMLVTRSRSPSCCRRTRPCGSYWPRDLRSAEARQLFAFMPTVTSGLQANA